MPKRLHIRDSAQNHWVDMDSQRTQSPVDRSVFAVTPREQHNTQLYVCACVCCSLWGRALVRRSAEGGALAEQGAARAREPCAPPSSSVSFPSLQPLPCPSTLSDLPPPAPPTAGLRTIAHVDDTRIDVLCVSRPRWRV